jgi:hypothetical protein
VGSGTNGAVLALTEYNGELVAGGSFTTAGGNPANRIARWNGFFWWPMDSGMDLPVLALAVYNGELIAGGNFTLAGGLGVSFLARWDGGSWQPLGVGTSHAVTALTEYNHELIAGGEFLFADGQFVNHIVGVHVLPYIIQQPQNMLVAEGQAAHMSVVLANSDAGLFTYQWRKNGIPLADGGNISGASTDSLTINSATAADFGVYDVRITNDCGSVIGSPAALGVLPTPGGCFADLAPPGGNGVVNVDDLLAVIVSWGACP